MGYEDDFTIEMSVQVSKKRVEDLLATAFEGGSNYWIDLVKYKYPNGQTKESLGIEFEHIELPMRGGSILVYANEEYDPDIHTRFYYVLNEDACLAGLKYMARNYYNHFTDFMQENEDAITADVFLQCALFGKVVYG